MSACLWVLIENGKKVKFGNGNKVQKQQQRRNLIGLMPVKFGPYNSISGKEGWRKNYNNISISHKDPVQRIWLDDYSVSV